MITVKDVYNIIELEDPIEFKNKVKLRNLKKVESGELSVYEVFRQTGRTELMIASAVSLLSLNQRVVICTHNMEMLNIVKRRMSEVLLKINKITGIYLANNVHYITQSARQTDLLRLIYDVELIDEVRLDLKMRRTGLYR